MNWCFRWTTPAQAGLLEQHQQGLLPLSAFMRPALSFVGDVTTVPDQVCANRRRMKDFAVAAEVHEFRPRRTGVSSSSWRTGMESNWYATLTPG